MSLRAAFIAGSFADGIRMLVARAAVPAVCPTKAESTQRVPLLVSLGTNLKHAVLRQLCGDSVKRVGLGASRHSGQKVPWTGFDLAPRVTEYAELHRLMLQGCRR